MGELIDFCEILNCIEKTKSFLEASYLVVAEKGKADEHKISIGVIYLFPKS